jgi:site-specific DNA recombinase
MNASKAVILARVSSKAQEDEGYSLPAQEKLLDEYCSSQNLSVIKVFRLSESASKDKQRKVFKEMMGYLSKNSIHVLVCEKADRLTRNFRDMVQIDDWLNDNDSRSIHLVKDGLKLSKDSRSQEKLNWGMRVLIAKNYIDNLKEEVAKGMKEKMEQGWYPHVPPHGYKTIGEKGHKTHIIDWDIAPIVKRLFEEYLSPNHNTRTITELAEKLGLRTRMGKPLSKSSISELLSNEFYVGINVWNGMRYPGKQDTFIEKSLFDEVQRKKTRKTTPKYSKHNPTYKSMMVCKDCKGTITWEIQKGTWYGHCNGYKECPKKPWAREDLVDKEIIRALNNLQCPSPSLMSWVVDALKKKYAKENEVIESSHRQLSMDITQKRRMLGLLYEDRLSGRITAEQYDEKKASIDKNILDLEQSSRELSSSLEMSFNRGIELLNLSQEAADMYPEMTTEEKRETINSIFASMSLNGREFEYKLSPLAQIISKKVEKHYMLVKSFEHSPDPSKKDLHEEVCSTWLRGEDLNLRPNGYTYPTLS